MSPIPFHLGWSEDLVKEAWSQDREGACQKAGLDPDAVVVRLEEERAERYMYSTGSLSVREVQQNCMFATCLQHVCM